MMIVWLAFALVRFVIRCTTGECVLEAAGRMFDSDSVPVTPAVPVNVTTPPFIPAMVRNDRVTVSPL